MSARLPGPGAAACAYFAGRIEYVQDLTCALDTIVEQVLPHLRKEDEAVLEAGLRGVPQSLSA